jgi:hypothetical protein
MPPVPPIPAEPWSQIPPAAQATILALIQQYEQRLQALQRKVDQLTEHLNQNSTNSSRPPPSDPPHVQRRPPKPSSGRKKGGQPGRAHQQRPLVPPEQVKQTVPLMPSACRKGGQALHGKDPHPRKRQVAEIPPVQAEVTESATLTWKGGRPRLCCQRTAPNLKWRNRLPARCRTRVKQAEDVDCGVPHEKWTRS